MARKKKKFTVSILFAVGLLALLSVVIFNASDRYFRAPMFPAFGISLPSGYSIHGIDVSHHQSVIEWESVREMSSKGQRIGFTFIKATEGISSVDPHFARNWDHSSGNSLPRGAYHYFLANKDSRLQAKNFIKTVKLEKGDLPPVLDVEETAGVNSEMMRKRVIEWLSIVEEYYGVKPILYTNVKFYEQHLSGELDKYPLWVAHYYHSRKPRIGRSWLFWQHNERGRVSGIRTRVDFNVFNGDSADFARILIH